MKASFFMAAVPKSPKRIRVGLVLAVAMAFLHQDATAATPINYGTASGFAILAKSGISDAGGSAITGNAATGNVGLSPAAGTLITGLTAGQVGGLIYTTDGTGPQPNVNNPGFLTTAIQGFSDAFDAAGLETPTASPLGLQLAGQNLIPGVYTFVDGTVLLNGTLTLNANGEANPVWIFLATSDLTTGSGSSIVFLNGGVPCDVLWRVPTQATLGSGSFFEGTLMAGAAIAMDTSVTLHGRAWAGTAVTLAGNDTITGLPCTSLGDHGVPTVPDAGGTLLMLGSGLGTLLAIRRRFFSLV
jgi:hypothetical protein